MVNVELLGALRKDSFTTNKPNEYYNVMQAIRFGREGVSLVYGPRESSPGYFGVVSGILPCSINDFEDFDGFYKGLKALSEEFVSHPKYLELVSPSDFLAKIDSFGVESIDRCPKGEMFLDTSFWFHHCHYNLKLRLHEKDYVEGKEDGLREFVYTSSSHASPPSSYELLSRHIGQATRRLEELIYPNKPGVEY